MRCQNCGWPNKPQATTCSKCGSPLEAETYTTPTSPSNSGQSSMPENVGKTVLESDVFGGGGQSQDTPFGQQGERCPSCGYPLRPGVDKCPQCRAEVHPHTPDLPPVHRPTRLDTPGGNVGGGGAAQPGPNKHRQPIGGTVNPYVMGPGSKEHTFRLTPIAHANDRYQLEEQEYDGQEVTLNRDNTDPYNGTITSREQAVVYHVGGRWFIEDRSEQHTTFVRASKAVELHEGDIVLLGDRMFEFHE